MLFDDGIFPVVKGPPTGSADFHFLPEIEEVVFPKERFVTYEPRDAEWAVPLGIAKRVKRGIRPDDEIVITQGGYEVRGQVTDIEMEDPHSPLPRFSVKFVVLGTRVNLTRQLR